MKRDANKLADLADEIKAAAVNVLRGMKETPGGDAYEYQGSMFAVEWLKEAVEKFDDYKIFGEPEK